MFVSIRANERHTSLELLIKIDNIITNLQQNQSALIQKVANAKRTVTESLRNFYFSSVFIESELLKMVVREEDEMIQFGETIDKQWCWENNLPLLKGSVGWVGNNHSDCVKETDKGIMDVVLRIYNRFQEDLANLTKYDPLEVFIQRNIILNPQSISDAIDERLLVSSNVNLDYSSIVEELKSFLNSRLDGFYTCLKDANDSFRSLIVDMTSYTNECLEGLK
ncbi:uncharacterized protein LOC129730642 isoform X2 [Wyeomyia smithii]|uniref:uncharacterized protein LOC129730642 isoform X2 n=1 Tax=Wyeomyia smithii TaxID=174621 RepID=UPI002467E846|nr:uncharacterized protein LOC129730642 isoform X2 [Wyeomyia smithii]